MSDETLVDRIRAVRTERRRKAAGVYHDALLKGSLRDGDEDAVACAMEVLGRGPDDLNHDAELVQRIGQWGALADQVETLLEESRRKRVALTNAEGEHEKAVAAVNAEWEPKVVQLRQGLAQIQARATEAAQARTELATLQSRWDAIVSGALGTSAVSGLAGRRIPPGGRPARPGIEVNGCV